MYIPIDMLNRPLLFVTSPFGAFGAMHNVIVIVPGYCYKVNSDYLDFDYLE